MKFPWVSRKKYREMELLCHEIAGEFSVLSTYPECPQWMRRRCNQMLIKGRRLLAERIREVSEKAGVPYPPTRGRRNQYLELAVRRRKEAKQMRHGRDMLFGAVKYLDKEKL